MKYCPKCGWANADPEPVCRNCGSPFFSSENGGGRQYDSRYSGVPHRSSSANGFAVASLVLGIVGIVTVWCCGSGVVPAILAIIFGFIARGSSVGASGNVTDRSMAMAGIILGVVTIAGLLIVILIRAALGLAFFSLSGFPGGGHFSNGGIFSQNSAIDA